MNKGKKRLISAFAALSLSMFLIVGAIYFLSDLSPSFADHVNATLSQNFRQIMANIGGIFPFSLFQVIVASIPLFVFLVVYLAIRAFSRGEGIRFIINLASTVLLLYSGHLLALGIGYNTTDISQKMNLNRVEVSEENLTKVMLLLTEEINSLAAEMPRDENGVFSANYSDEEISKKLCESFESFSEKYGVATSFDSRFKSASLGNFMSYLGLTGIYTYYTGEANVNADYPDYVRIFTAAHEMSHQRGILRENEANFTAYLVTSTSNDPCIRYSGALEMYGYFASALYKTNENAYYSVAEQLSQYARADIRASNAVWQKYGDTIISDVSDWINNLYLKSNGTDGVITYSRVVHLVVSYYE